MSTTNKMKAKRAEMNKNPKIEYGNVDLTPGEFDNAQVRVTMWLESELLAAIKKRASEEGEKYQPWMRKRLQEIVSTPSETIQERVAALEQAVFKKRA